MTTALLLPANITELNARERALALLDPGTFRELLGPFDRAESPWLEPQGVVPQSDDGVVVARGTIGRHRVVVLSMEGGFQGGSVGEVSGAKISVALALARRDALNGRPVVPILLLETGGVRLQEANLGLNAVAEICDQIVQLRSLVPVIGVIAGLVGSFGGMSIAGALCSALIVTKEARFGLNGPQVIEEESGVDEFDAADRALSWAISGGGQQERLHHADELVANDIHALRDAVQRAIERGVKLNPVTQQVVQALNMLYRVATLPLPIQSEDLEPFPSQREDR